jgi:ubiquinone/menaquinone biosynthesis C-methylase UbiE
MRVDEERQYWDKAAADPDVDQKYIADVDTEECLKALSPLGKVIELSSIKILDLGCGVGRLAIPIAKRFIDHQVFAVDISEEMIRIMVERSGDMENLSPIVNDGRKLRFGSDTFMAAYSMLLFQHLDEDGVLAYIQEVGRILKRGGIFRFQFIEGTENEPFSHHYDRSVIIDYLAANGIKVSGIDEGLVHEQWTWITGVKQ